MAAWDNLATVVEGRHRFPAMETRCSCKSAVIPRLSRWHLCLTLLCRRQRLMCDKCKEQSVFILVLKWCVMCDRCVLHGVWYLASIMVLRSSPCLQQTLHKHFAGWGNMTIQNRWHSKGNFRLLVPFRGSGENGGHFISKKSPYLEQNLCFRAKFPGEKNFQEKSRRKNWCEGEIPVWIDLVY